MKLINKISYFVFSLFVYTNLTVLSPQSKALDLRNKNEQIEKKTSPVVRIFSGASPGSGVVIGRNKNVYTIVTAAHVIESSNIEEIEIEYKPGKYSRATKVLRPFKNKDIVFISFKQSDDIPLAVMPFLDDIFWNRVNDWSYIVVEGIANKSKELPEATRRSSSGSLLSLLDNTKDGYDFVHTAITNIGMSGGAIYATPSFDEISNLIVIQDFKNSNLFNYITQEEIFKLDEKRLDYELKFYDEVWDLKSKFEKDNEIEIIKKYGPDSDEAIWGYGYIINTYVEFDKALKGEIIEVKSNLFSKNEKILYKKCVSGSWRDDPSILSQKNLSKSFDEAREDVYEQGGDPPWNLPLTCLSASSIHTNESSNIENPYGGKVCYFDGSSKLLLAIHGRAEAYNYGGKSGAGIGIFLGSNEISKWLKLNSKNLGLPLTTNGDAISKRICTKDI